MGELLLEELCKGLEAGGVTQQLVKVSRPATHLRGGAEVQTRRCVEGSGFKGMGHLIYKSHLRTVLLCAKYNDTFSFVQNS